MSAPRTTTWLMTSVTSRPADGVGGQGAEAAQRLAQRRRHALDGGSSDGDDVEAEHAGCREEVGHGRDPQPEHRAADDEEDAGHGRADERPGRLAQARHRVAGDQLVGRSRQRRQERARERRVLTRQDALDDRGGDDDPQPEVEGDGGGGERHGRGASEVKPEEHPGRAERVEDRRENRPEQARRERRQEGEGSDRHDVADLVGVDQQRHQVRLLGRDPDQPRQLEAPQRRVGQHLRQRFADLHRATVRDR